MSNKLKLRQSVVCLVLDSRSFKLCVGTLVGECVNDLVKLKCSQSVYKVPVLDFVHASADFAEGKRTGTREIVEVAPAKRCSLVFSKFPHLGIQKSRQIRS